MRTLFAIVYDGIIVVSLMILLSFPVVIMNHGQAVLPGNKLYLFYLLTILFSYIWLMAKLCGQTIGMKAWRLCYQHSGTNSLWLGLLIRYCLFIPITIASLGQEPKREKLLERLSGITKKHKP